VAVLRAWVVYGGVCQLVRCVRQAFGWLRVVGTLFALRCLPEAPAAYARIAGRLEHDVRFRADTLRGPPRRSATSEHTDVPAPASVTVTISCVALFHG
jgi:hypothetical protein